MAWFTAHIVIGMLVEGQESVVAWENIVLIEAESRDEAKLLAEQIGNEEAALDDGMMIGSKAVHRKFAGVRKVANIYNYYGRMNEDPPSHRCELSHSEYILQNIADLEKLGTDEDVTVTYTV